MFGVVPKPLWEKWRRRTRATAFALAMRAWLVRGGGRTVLIDAGCGDKLDRKAADIYALERDHTLEHALAGRGRISATPSISSFASHLHFDHAGGFTARAGGTAVPRFPKRALLDPARRVGRRHASARAEPRQLLRGKLRAARGCRTVGLCR